MYDRNTLLLYVFLLRIEILILNHSVSFMMDLLSSTSISTLSTVEELLATYDSQAAEFLNAYKEETYLLYLSAESEGSNSVIPATDGNSCHGLRLHPPIKSSEDTVQRDSHHSATLRHDHINYNGTDHNHEAGFCAFDTFVDYPDNECFAAIDAASYKLMKSHIPRGTRIMFAYKGPNSVLGELEGISMVMQLGHTLLRHDLEEFTKGSLHAWLRGGLWPHVNHSGAYKEDIGE
jgi:hypothetical protein